VNDATRERVLGLLVDEHYARALAAGYTIRNVPGWRATARERVLDQETATPGWLQLQADRLLGEVKRPEPWADPDADLEPVRLADWLEAGAPCYPDGPDHARAALDYMRRAGHRMTPDETAADAIAAHPWPRPADRYLEHDPSPAVALAIATDLHHRLAATRAGRDPDLAMRQGWDARLAPIDADDTRL
jgi:hypothetical protein